MAQIIAKFGYLKGKSRGGYAKYIATREGVEKLDESLRGCPVTQSQQEFINKLLEDFPEEWMNSRGAPSRAEWAAYIALTLFAVHQQGNDPAASPMHCAGCPLGRAVRRLVPADDADAEIRILRRFEQMATAVEIQGVSQHLRGIVQLLRAGGIPLDYAALAHDLYQYQFPEAVAGVRLRWAQDFYRRPLEDKDNTNTSEGKED